MNTRCKVGDLAWCRDSLDPTHIGAICEVLECVEVDPFRGVLWRVSVRGVRGIDTGKILNGDAYAPDHCLTPITGLPVDEDVKDDIKEPA